MLVMLVSIRYVIPVDRKIAVNIKARITPPKLVVDYIGSKELHAGCPSVIVPILLTVLAEQEQS